jgi:hypothetical protein
MKLTYSSSENNFIGISNQIWFYELLFGLSILKGNTVSFSIPSSYSEVFADSLKTVTYNIESILKDISTVKYVDVFHSSEDHSADISFSSHHIFNSDLKDKLNVQYLIDRVEKFSNLKVLEHFDVKFNESVELSEASILLLETALQKYDSNIQEEILLNDIPTLLKIALVHNLYKLVDTDTEFDNILKVEDIAAALQFLPTLNK